MEEPVFYCVRADGKPLSLRQRNTLLKKITRLKSEAAALQTHAAEITRYARRLGIAAPEISSFPLMQWPRILQGIQQTQKSGPLVVAALHKLR